MPIYNPLETYVDFQETLISTHVSETATEIFADLTKFEGTLH